MIKIKENLASNAESNIADIIDYINEILNYAKCNSDFNYVISYNDMYSLNEAVKKLRRVVSAKNAFDKRCV